MTFNHVLEHVPRPGARAAPGEELLQARWLVVAVSVPNFGAWQRRAFGSAHWCPLDLPRHLQHYDRGSLPADREHGRARAAGGALIVTARGLSVSSVQYALRGRLFLVRRDGMHPGDAPDLSALILVADLVLREGDCLHVVAERS